MRGEWTSSNFHLNSNWCAGKRTLTLVSPVTSTATNWIRQKWLGSAQLSSAKTTTGATATATATATTATAKTKTTCTTSSFWILLPHHYQHMQTLYAWVLCLSLPIKFAVRLCHSFSLLQNNHYFLRWSLCMHECHVTTQESRSRLYAYL